jgi:hypothetical protein
MTKDDELRLRELMKVDAAVARQREAAHEKAVSLDDIGQPSAPRAQRFDSDKDPFGGTYHIGRN